MFEGQLSCSLKRNFSNKTELSPWYIHWLLLADSSRGWGDYMAWLEEQLREQVRSPRLLGLSGEGAEEISY